MHALSGSLILGLLLAAPAANAAQCNDYTVEAVQNGPDMYDPSAGAGILVSLRILPASISGGGSCQGVEIAVATEDGTSFAPSFGGQALALEPQRSNKTANLSLLGAKLTGTARGDVLSGAGVSVPLYLIRPGQFVPAGTYRENLVVTVDDGAPVTVPYTITVGSAVRFVPENGANAKTLSFGEVTQGSRRSSSIYYLANGPFEIRIRSENGGKLLHELGSSFGTISYDASYDGQALLLDQGPTVIQKSAGTSTVQVDDLVVSIAPQPGKYAGRYHDVLTLDYLAY